MDSTIITANGTSGFVGLVDRWGSLFTCAVAGFLSAFTVSVVGQLPVGELLFVAMIPWVFFRAYKVKGWPTRMQQLGWYRLLFILVAVMLFGYVVSDLFRGTTSSNLARGWARVTFLGVDLIAIAYLIDQSWARFRVLLFSLYFGAVVNAALTGPLYGEWWKFGLGYAVTITTFFAVAGRPMFFQVLTAFALGAISLALGSRSLGGVCLLVGGLLWLHEAHGIWRPIALFASVATVFAFLFAANTVVLENQDHSGSNVERQSMIETAGEAFLSNPLIGQGSWFTASKLIAKLEERRAQKDPTFREYSEEDARKLSIHSQLLVALSEGGIFGGLFFLGMGALLLKSIRSATQNPVPCRALVLCVLVASLWNLCMSPFSGVARVEIVVAICACLLVILQRQGELPEDFRE